MGKRENGDGVAVGLNSVPVPFQTRSISVKRPLHIWVHPEGFWLQLAAGRASPFGNKALSFQRAGLLAVDLDHCADEDTLAGIGHAKPPHVHLGYVTLAVTRRKQTAEGPVVTATRGAAVLRRRGVEFDGVGNRFREFEPHDDTVAPVGDLELPHRVRVSIHRRGRDRDERQTEAGPGHVYFEEEGPRGHAA
jgi:hypothetical protein